MDGGLFICGLHRSGISILGRNITSMENCTGFTHIAVSANESQFLQGMYHE
jgi:hypothetical protein